MFDKLFKFISMLITAMSDISLYTKDHPAIIELAQEEVNMLEELYADDSMSITLLGGNMLFNDNLVTGSNLHAETCKKKMKKKGIEKIIFKKGVTPDEMMKFISDMASTDATMESTEHILVGTVHVKFKSSGDDAKVILDENMSVVKEVYQEVSRFKDLDLVSLEDAVLGFIAALKREANVLRIISPVKSYSGYTYVHATNVAVLAVFQAESLGLKGENLHEIGLAGLLHDVGKMFVAKEVLEKPDSLNECDWVEMRKHPSYGAMYLSTLQDAPRLAVLVAFEHHMKFNGTGYPDTRRRGRRQHIISQMIAIADVFDALRTERPYRKPMTVPEILEVIRNLSGKELNPLLVDNFISAFSKIGAV